MKTKLLMFLLALLGLHFCKAEEFPDRIPVGSVESVQDYLLRNSTEVVVTFAFSEDPNAGPNSLWEYDFLLNITEPFKYHTREDLTNRISELQWAQARRTVLPPANLEENSRLRFKVQVVFLASNGVWMIGARDVFFSLERDNNGSWVVPESVRSPGELYGRWVVIDTSGYNITRAVLSRTDLWEYDSDDSRDQWAIRVSTEYQILSLPYWALTNTWDTDVTLTLYSGDTAFAKYCLRDGYRAPTLTMGLNANGKFLNINAPPGREVILEKSTDLTEWRYAATIVTTTSNTRYTDCSGDVGFFRARYR